MVLAQVKITGQTVTLQLLLVRLLQKIQAGLEQTPSSLMVAVEAAHIVALGHGTVRLEGLAVAVRLEDQEAQETRPQPLHHRATRAATVAHSRVAMERAVVVAAMAQEWLAHQQRAATEG